MLLLLLMVLRLTDGKLFVLETDKGPKDSERSEVQGLDYSSGTKTAFVVLGDSFEMNCGSMKNMETCGFKTPEQKKMKTSKDQEEFENGRLKIIISNGRHCKLVIKSVKNDDWGKWTCLFSNRNGKKQKNSLKIFPSNNGGTGGSTLSPLASTLSPLASTTNPIQAGAAVGAYCIPGIIKCRSDLQCINKVCHKVKKPGGSCGFGRRCGVGLGCVMNVCTAGVPERIEVHYNGNPQHGNNYKGTYLKAGFELYGYPVYRQNDYFFFRTKEGFWCFNHYNYVFIKVCRYGHRVPVKAGRFPIIPPETGWQYVKRENDLRNDAMTVVSHW